MRVSFYAVASIVAGMALVLSRGVWADEALSVVVINTSEEDLSLNCRLGVGSTFFAYPNERQHVFDSAGKGGVILLDIHAEDAIQYPWPNIVCRTAAAGGFDYALLINEQREVVRTYGPFAYDSAYPGAIVYKGLALEQLP
jgi:hypothetical protein